MAKAVKMADIAERLGVSTVTVSKALSGQKGVSEELRQRIREMAEELGYKPPASQGIDRPSLTVGILMSETYIEKYVTFYWEFYQKIITAAARQGCFVLLEVLPLEAEQSEPDIKLLKENKINGLMVLGGLQSSYLSALKKNCPVPVIYMDFYNGQVTEDSIISNNFYGSYFMTNYLFDCGHRAIAYVGTLLATDSITDRYLGYCKSMMEHGVEVKKEWIIPDRDEPRRCFERITLPEHLPTAFVCNCDQTASMVVRALEERGISVPEQASVVGYDDYLHPGLCSVELTTYAVDMARMAEQGVEVLVNKICGREYRTGIQVVEGRLVDRKSVRKIKSATKTQKGKA